MATGDGLRSRLGYSLDLCEAQDRENMNYRSVKDLREFHFWRWGNLDVNSERCNTALGVIDEHYGVR